VNLDEKVILSEWNPQWKTDFAILAEDLRAGLGDSALRIDHIGSTSVPGLLAKDVIDAQVIVAQLDTAAMAGVMDTAGFEQKFGAWNLRDHIPAGWVGDPERWSKLLFAPSHNARDSNVHIRVTGSPNERYALLFREFLRADDATRMAWGRFKSELALNTEDLSDYGAVKDPATDVLLALVERWAADTS
jgi:dephospho-CoA kinase